MRGARCGARASFRITGSRFRAQVASFRYAGFRLQVACLTIDFITRNQTMEDKISGMLIEEAKYRLLEESIPRLRRCLDQLSEEEVWFRPNENTVSIGNLVLHLCGNVQQWLVSGLGGAADHRRRQREFDEPGPLPTTELHQMLDKLDTEIKAVLEGLTSSDLVSEHRVQGYNVSGVSILVHVVEHFSYHVGQVTILVKSRMNVDMGYYAGQDLGKHNDE